MDHKKYFILYPPSLVYKLITDIRNLFYDIGVFPALRFSLPVISIGNITVGGTGKTPHTEYVADLLRDKYRVAVLSRGYKRKTTGFLEVKASLKTEEAGDEPLQIARKFNDVLVAVDGNRVHGAGKIIEGHPETDVIILDDAFQHRRIKAGLSILLTDYNRLISRDHMLPYGRLRERRANSKRADIIIVTKSPEDLPEKTMSELGIELKISSSQYLFFTTTVYQEPVPVFEGGHEKLNLTEAEKNSSGVVLVTGIANSRPLRAHIENYFNEIIHLDFPDHHYFNGNDIRKIACAAQSLKSGRKLILTTSKDAVRLTEFTNIATSMKEIFYYIPVGVRFLGEGKQLFDKIIIDYVGKNHKNSPVP